MGKQINMLATGELILNMEENPTYYFEHVKELFDSADLVVGHLENMHTDRPYRQGGYVAPTSPMKNIVGVKYAGFDIVTLASNATYMSGPPGIEDTISWLDENGIAHVGAGMDITEARKPRILEREGVKFGFLSYNCLGGDAAAAHEKPGCAYVDIVTYYHPPMFPGGKPVTYTFAERHSLEAMREDIRALRPICDVLVVAIHAGMGFDEGVLADYEYHVPREAINAGADLILANHSHVLKAIEFYRGVPIYHCLCNLVTVFPWHVHRMFMQEEQTTLNRSRIRPRSGYSKHWLNMEHPNYPFPDISLNSIIGKILVDADTKKITQIGFIPVRINNEGQPIPVGNDELGRGVVEYMEKVTKIAECNAKYKWDGDEVIAYY